MTQADAVSYRFVPALLAIAVSTLVIQCLFGPDPRCSNALRGTLAALIVACPPALDLATPMTIMVAAGRSAHDRSGRRDCAQRSAFSTSRTNFGASVVVHTPGEYTSTKEIRMNTTTETNKTTTLSIDGMSCGHCVQAVTKALSAVPGVKVRSVAVGSAVIEAADGWTTGKAVAALDEAGYPARAAADVSVTVAASPARSGGGCCGGAKNAMPGGAPGAKTSGGCCG